MSFFTLKTGSLCAEWMFSCWRIVVYTWQPVGPLLRVKLLAGNMQNPTKLKGAKGITVT